MKNIIIIQKELSNLLKIVRKNIKRREIKRGEIYHNNEDHWLPGYNDDGFEMIGYIPENSYIELIYENLIFLTIFKDI